ncbi:MAG: Rpn family recombination-promoting nuclease/putative transposase [Planctomycetota bacterium]
MSARHPPDSTRVDPRVGQAPSVLRAPRHPVGVRLLDLSQAELRPSLFKDDDLHERRADFLFKVPLAGEDAYLLTLLEHQSRQDSTLAARLLVYAGRALDRHMREHPGAKRLPAVIPVVLYHGERAWTAPRELLELYAPMAWVCVLNRARRPSRG